MTLKFIKQKFEDPPILTSERHETFRVHVQGSTFST